MKPIKYDLEREPIYLDHNASTPPAKEVVEAMLPWLGTAHANPHSEHFYGRRAASAVENARASVADLIGAEPGDIFFTSGATESNNLVLQGMLTCSEQTRMLVISAIEHKSILETAIALGTKGVNVVHIPVDSMGRVSPTDIVMAVKASSAAIQLVSVMHSNNEIGTIQPIAAISEKLRETTALLHVDAAQSIGKIRVDVVAECIDFMSLSSHKMSGPAGIGAVYIAPGLRGRLKPLMFGGGQQGSLRPGTVPVFLAVGFGAACELVRIRMRGDAVRCIENVVEIFLSRLAAQAIPHEVLGHQSFRLPGLRSIRFHHVDASDLLTVLSKTVSASSGAACTSGEIRASHVLRAIGLAEHEALQVVRFGFGKDITEADAVLAADHVAAAVRRLRSRV